ncbi:maltokinase N-terminal cap-like domain-containing protein [Nocardia lijiangensis]|uniref:maltokinase N-terminal cap-like domain-containing protein n=1 Tax=Nocardia lijiangensis TaxID=299618 RepID=UPI00082B9B28|nr:1,4-alpha-glucan branching protein [Nocardia lijiangensis]
MAVIHRTTMSPKKQDLLADWLPSRPWYRGGARPRLAKAGGFRLDDPAGEVGIEFMVVTDDSGARPVTYHVPLTYRGAELPDGAHALIGTSVHGVLGLRWIYDGSGDPIAVAQIAALLSGNAQPQAQAQSDTPDHSVVVSNPVSDAVATEFAVMDEVDDTEITLVGGPLLRVHRRLDPAAAPPGIPTVTAPWRAADGAESRSVLLSVHG